MSLNLQGALLALVAFASYSFMDGSIKYIVSYTNLPWQILIFCVSFVIVLILLFTLIFSKQPTFKVKRPFWLLIRAIIGVTNLHIIFFIIPKVNLDLFYSLVFVSPILASILAIFILGERLNIHKLISILIGFCGILIITTPWSYISKNHFNWLELVPLLVAFSDAAIGIIARKYLINDKPSTLVFYQFVLCTVISGIFSFFTYTEEIVISSNIIFLIILTSLLSLSGYIFYIKAVQKAPIQIVLPMGYSQMAFGVIISIFLFYQYPTINTIIGAIIIILGSTYMLLYASKTKKESI